MENPVLCPWCGTEMKVVMHYMCGWCRCPKCEATSPLEYGSEADVEKTARALREVSGHE